MTANDETDEPNFFDDPELMKLFLEVHSGNPREGPGDNVSTLRALGMIPGLPEQPDILDIACGPGMQTMALADATGGQITALDIFRHFLDQVEHSALERGMEKSIRTVKGSMFDLPFEQDSFDLLWSEGAIYIMGFEKGLREWRKFLRPRGAIAVTHISWLREDVCEIPKTLFDWWMNACPDIRPIRENLAIIEKCGYELTLCQVTRSTENYKYMIFRLLHHPDL